MDIYGAAHAFHTGEHARCLHCGMTTDEYAQTHRVCPR